MSDSAAPVSVSPEAFLTMGREVLAKQAFSVLIGAELTALEPGRCDVFALQGGEEKLVAMAQGTIMRLGEPADG